MAATLDVARLRQMRIFEANGGEGGIRTPGTVDPYDDLANRRFSLNIGKSVSVRGSNSGRSVSYWAC